jgi:hypothetical protein
VEVVFFALFNHHLLEPGALRCSIRGHDDCQPDVVLAELLQNSARVTRTEVEEPGGEILGIQENQARVLLEADFDHAKDIALGLK